jgi:hypothetical protein
MTTTKSPSAQTENDGLDLVLRRLVLRGTLTNDQARSVHEAYLDEVGPPRVATPERHGLAARGWASKLAELGGYLGAALMAAAGAVVIGQQWSDMSRVGQVTLLLGLALAFVAVGGAIAALSHRREAKSTQTVQSMMRRLCSTLLTLGAAAAAGGVVVALLPATWPGTDVTASEVGRALLAAAVAAAAVLLIARIVAPSALAEAALYGAVLGASGSVLLLMGADTETPPKTVFFMVGVGWAVLATFSHVVTVPSLAAALGLVTAFYAAIVGEEAWSRNTFLGILVAVGIAVYLARPSWPYIAAAMLSAVALTVSVLGDRFGPALALLAAGFVLLAFAGAVLLVQRRRGAPRGAG